MSDMTPKVKPLVWERMQNGAAKADTPLARYVVSGGCWSLWTHTQGETRHAAHESAAIDAALDLEAMAREAAMQYLSDTGQMMDRIAALEAQVKAADALMDMLRIARAWLAYDGRYTLQGIDAALATYRAAKDAQG